VNAASALMLRSSAAADGGRCLTHEDLPPARPDALRSSAAADGGRCREHMVDELEQVKVAILGRRGRRPLRPCRAS